MKKNLFFFFFYSFCIKYNYSYIVFYLNFATFNFFFFILISQIAISLLQIISKTHATPAQEVFLHAQKRWSPQWMSYNRQVWEEDLVLNTGCYPHSFSCILLLSNNYLSDVFKIQFFNFFLHISLLLKCSCFQNKEHDANCNKAL